MKAFVVCLMCLSGAYSFVMPPVSQDNAPIKRETEVSKPNIKSLHIRSDIAFRFSTTHVTSKLANGGQNATEATFHVTLPKTAFMTNFSMNIDGKVIHGEVKEKAVAKAQYERAQSLGQSGGFVAATKRESNNFKVSVNVEAGKEVTFDLEYQEVLQRRLGYYEHVINIDPGQVVPDLQVEVNINESRPITKLNVPPIKKDKSEASEDQVHPDAVITRTGINSGSISYKPTQEQQKADSDKGINGQFVVQYDVQRALDGGELQVVNGYFVHALAPTGLPPVPKNILFILDVSGSMYGRKMRQVKEAMRTILDDIRHDDTFNLLTFDGQITFWKNDLQKVDDNSIREANAFVSRMRARGMTNIDGALSQGINFLDRQEESDQERPSIIIFLTDGDPTEGETNTQKIQTNIRNLNNEKYTLFSLGFGESLDFNFLKQLSLQNGGLARKIYEASDASLQLKNFYREVSIPLLSDVTIKYQTQGGEVIQVTKHTYKTFFSGGEMMIAGRLGSIAPGGCTVRPCLSATSAMGNIQICPPGPWPPISPPIRPTPSWTPETGLAGHVERMWAYLTIRELLDKELRATNATEKEALKKEALRMSLRYKFVTPLTSMVVTLPEEPNATLGDLRDSSERGIQRGLYQIARLVPYSGGGMPHLRMSSGNMGGSSHMQAFPARLPSPHTSMRPLGSRGYVPARMPGLPGLPSGGSTMNRATSTTKLPSTTAAPVLGSPSIMVLLPSGVVCLSWPQMAHSAHTLLKDQGVEIQATHGRRGALESIMIRTPTGTSLITPSQMLIASQLRPWGQGFTENNVTVTGNKVTFSLLTGVKVAVHKVNAADLSFELIDNIGLTPSTTGILKYAHSWLLRGTHLRTPTPHGTMVFLTSPGTTAGVTCRAAIKDIFDVTRYSRRA